MMLAVAILAWIVALGAARKNLPEYIIDLDLGLYIFIDFDNVN